MSDSLTESGDAPVASNMETMASLVCGASALFYWAEKDENPAVQTYWDAFHYIATSLSVGYSNIFPVTQVGKIIGGVIMMVGPSLSARSLEPTAPASDPALLAKLDEILAALKTLAPKT